jgi:hypothetical protein
MQHILDATRTRTGFRTPRRDIMWHLSDITSNVLEDIIYECAVWCKQDDDDDDIMMMATALASSAGSLYAITSCREGCRRIEQSTEPY